MFRTITVFCLRNKLQPNNMSKKFILQCVNCGNQLPAGAFAYLCPPCSEKQTSQIPPLGVLKTLYDYEGIKKKYSTVNLFEALKANHFIDILPIENNASRGTLRVGNTPLYEFELGSKDGGKLKFLLKDDSQNPTFSLKDRASQVVSAYARENGFDTMVAASTGNAGSSLAGICASQGQRAIIMVPKTVPQAKLTQIIMYGATPVLVDGNYDAAFDLSVEASKHFGWFNRNTGFNPLTIEGKKTVSLEIYDQLNGKLPSVMFVSAGDGVIISGVYKGFEDLLKLGIISNIPTIVAVQSERSDNLVRNMNTEDFVMTPSTTMADSISVDYPRNFYMAKSFLKKYQGKWLTVSDEEIMKAASNLAKNTGIFAEPAAAAAMAGMIKYSNYHNDHRLSSMLVLSTGSGLKDLNACRDAVKIPKPISPKVEELEKLLS